MIIVTKFDGKELVVNADLVKFVEAKPDTIMTLTTGERIIVKEPRDEVISRIIKYKQLVHQPPVQ
ncbi:MAG: flagellar FlbD family protein [Candidatus Omnitrophota bacterium]